MTSFNPHSISAETAAAAQIRSYLLRSGSHRPTLWSVAHNVNPTRRAEEAHAGTVKHAQMGHQVGQALAEAVQIPGDHCLESPIPRVQEQLVQLRALVAGQQVHMSTDSQRIFWQ
jgi:hypothetical protein